MLGKQDIYIYIRNTLKIKICTIYIYEIPDLYIYIYSVHTYNKFGTMNHTECGSQYYLAHYEICIL
jgi:hypothetical protein